MKIQLAFILSIVTLVVSAAALIVALLI